MRSGSSRPASRRQKWIDQAQSPEHLHGGASGKKLDETYKLAWLRGLKTTYYLRTLGATHAEKSTTERIGRAECGVCRRQCIVVRLLVFGAASSTDDASNAKFCAIDDPTCEACQ
jgi:ribonucleoside-diphosphate reductase alpha chain